MRKRLGVLCATTFLTACGTPGMLSQTDANVSNAQTEGQSAFDTYSAAPIRAIEHVDGAWLAKRSVPINASIALPEFFKRNVRFATGAPLPMSIVLAQVARANGLTVRMASDVSCVAGAGGSGGSPGPGRSRGPANLFQLNCSDTGEPTVPLQYSGTLSGLLDTIAHRSGTHWSYRDGVVHFARYVTRTFQIKMMPGSSSYSASVGKASQMKANRGAAGGGGAGSSAGGVDLSFNADANVSVESELDYWSDLVLTVKDMLSEGGARDAVRGDEFAGRQRYGRCHRARGELHRRGKRCTRPPGQVAGAGVLRGAGREFCRGCRLGSGVSGGERYHVGHGRSCGGWCAHDP
ncbi:hypothetical protein EJE96_00960 [Pandoraea apista]|uniref:secretin N-terminal domain-containing protein n=1 Tax=Pandoraea apista TaxID=93218 RepID=UPI000F67932B|nr:secretin N-terminal domain-containing protein [Pandoraea apista]RSK88121.1 hypothetical protein EJE96_00960 [Pandoraea apista]